MTKEQRFYKALQDVYIGAKIEATGGFFKYYELEQYEEALANRKYEDGDLFYSPLIKGWTAEGRTGYLPGRIPYQEYVFMKDEKMLKALEIDYENNKVKVDLSKLYPNIDIAETLSNLTGKWIKKITPRPLDTPLGEENGLYHRPLLLTLVNSVNVE